MHGLLSRTALSESVVTQVDASEVSYDLLVILAMLNIPSGDTSCAVALRDALFRKHFRTCTCLPGTFLSPLEMKSRIDASLSAVVPKADVVGDVTQADAPEAASMDQGLWPNIDIDAHAPLTFDITAADDLAEEQNFFPDIVDEATCDAALCDIPLPFWCVEPPAAPSPSVIPLADFHLVDADPDPSGFDLHAPYVRDEPEVAANDAVPAAVKVTFCWADCDDGDVADGAVEPATPPRSARCAQGASPPKLTLPDELGPGRRRP